jgi:hypothetical protein
MLLPGAYFATVECRSRDGNSDCVSIASGTMNEFAQSMIVRALKASEGNREHSNAINFRLI